jgi:ribosomal protein S3
VRLELDAQLIADNITQLSWARIMFRRAMKCLNDQCHAARRPRHQDHERRPVEQDQKSPGRSGTEKVACLHALQADIDYGFADQDIMG